MNRTLVIGTGIVALLFSALTPAAMAACSNTAPASNTTVTCSGTGVPTVAAQAGSTGVAINIDPTVSGSFVHATNPVAFSVDTSSTITSSGNLSLTGGGGSGTSRGAVLLGVANNNVLTNAKGGVINTTGTYNDGMGANGSGNALTNNGTIMTSGPNAYGMTAAWGQTNLGQSNNSLTNTGAVSTSGSNARAASILGGGGTINNSGTLSTSGSSSPSAYLQGNNDQLINSGTIIANGSGSDAVFSNTVGSSFTATIQNLAGGQIISQSAAGIRTLNGNSTVINAGLVQSGVGTAIAMGNGNDSLILQTGSVISGGADGGAGSNTVTLQGSGTASNAFTNFQTLLMQGTLWNWTGSGAFNLAHVQTGTLNLTGTLGATSAAIVDTGAILQANAQSLPPAVTDNGAVVFLQAPDNGTYAGVISGSGTVAKLGLGTTLTLTGANTYSGGTFLDEGTVATGDDPALGARTGGLTFNGGTLQLLSGFTLAATRPIVLNGPSANLVGGGTIDTNGFQTTIAQGISGAGGLTKAGAGTLILTGNSGYTGGTTINAGILQLGDGGTAGGIVGDVADNGTLAFDRSDTVTFPSAISGAGNLTQIGTGTTVLTGTSTYTGGTAIGAGTLQLGAGGASGSILGDVADNGTLAFDRSDTVTFPSAISGAGNLTQIGTGTTVLTGTSTYTGGTAIGAGTLQLGAGGASGSILGDVADNGTLAFNRSDTVIFPGLISGAGGIVQAGTGTTILTQNETFTGGTVISQGTLQLGNGGGTAGRVMGPIIDNGALVFNRADLVSSPGQISGTGTVAQVGTGTTILSATNTYTGGTTITAGTLQIGDGNNSGSIVGNVLNDATLSFNRADTVTFPGVVSGTGLLVNNGSGTTILTGENTYTGGTRVAAGAIQLGGGGTSGSIAGDVSLTSGTLIFNRADTVTFPGTISGAGGSVVQAGAGTTILTGSNTFTNGTTISAGTLQLGNGGASGSVTSDILDNASLVFDRSGTVLIPYLISGTGNAAQVGTGTTILTANNTYSGTTTISAGTLQLGNGGSSGRVAGDVLDNGALVFDRSDVSPFGGAISGTGTVAQIGTGTTILTANNTYTGGTTITAGTLQLGNGGASGGIVGDVNNNSALAFNRSDVVTFPGVISGIGGVAQIGTGTTILTAVNPYSGGTAISAGTLAVGDQSHTGAALSGGGPVTIGSQATLSGYGSVTGTVTNAGTIAVGNALPLFANGPVATFNIIGDVQNAGVLNLSSPDAPGNTLVINGNYTATSANAALEVSTILNGGGALSNQFTDRLLIRGSDPGATTIRVNARGEGAFTSVVVPDAADGISLVQVAGSSTAGAFQLAGGYVTGGTPYLYVLNAYGPGSPNGPAFAGQSLVGNAGNHWDYRLQNAYVGPGGPVPPEPLPPEPPNTPEPPNPGPGPVPPPTLPQPPDPTPQGGSRPEVAPQVPAYLSTPTALFNAGFQDLDELHRRLGEIRDDQILGRAQPDEFFLRGYGARFNYTSDRSFAAYGFNAAQDYAALQFGGNWLAVDNPAGTLRVGLAGTLGRLWLQPSAIDGPSKGLFNTQNLAGIVTWQARAGWYVDAIVMGGMFDGQITTPSRGQALGLNGTSVAGSLEAGYPIPLGWQSLALEPQGQVVYQHLDFSRRTDVDGIAVDLGSPDQGVFRGGVRLTRRFTSPDGTLITPYLKANVLQGLGGGDNVRLDQIAFGTGRFGTALQAGGGVTGTLTRLLSVYGDVAWQHNVGGDGGARGWTFNGGLRLAFGAPAAAPAGVVAPPPAQPVRSYLVFFDWDQATLSDRARQIIAAAAAAAQHVQLTRIAVNGYADTSGTPHYNRGLSIRRAQAVAAELVRDGISRETIAIRGFGDTHLLVATGPGIREPQNRRVEIILQ